jgi:hypothetical protein
MTDKEVRGKLIQLLTDNPDLPIFATVEEEVVTGEYTTYLANIYSVYKTEYVYIGDRFYDDVDEAVESWIDDNYMDFPEDTPEEILDREAHKVIDPLVGECIILHISN